MVIKAFKNFSILLFLVFYNFLYSNISLGQNKDYLNTVIDRLNIVENELKNLQSSKIVVQKNNNGEFDYTNSIANHEQRLLEIEEEIRNLTGLLEEINFKMDNLINNKNQLTDVENEEIFSASESEKLSNSNLNQEKEKNIILSEDPNIKENPSMKVLGTVSENEDNTNIKNDTQTKKIDPKNSAVVSQKKITLDDEQLALINKNPSEIYSYAYEMLVRENFTEAEKSFKAFIGEHPKDPLASNAYYWLGETYYVQKNFQLAAISFARGFQNFPKGNKALDQLFKLALTFINLGKNEDACAAFSKLETEFPDAPKRISNRAKEYMQRAKC